MIRAVIPRRTRTKARGQPRTPYPHLSGRPVRLAFFEYGNVIDHIDDDTLHPFVGGKVTVPTEGKVSTVRVELVVPEGVELVSVADTAAPMTHARARLESRPSPGVESFSRMGAQILLYGAQSANWVAIPGSKRPASVTKPVAEP